MSAHAYAAVHLSHHAIDAREADIAMQRDAALNREHAVELSRRPKPRRFGSPGAALMRVTRSFTRSQRSLVAAAAAGGTRRI